MAIIIDELHAQPKSRPARGAWIEMADGCVPGADQEVAPRTGRVD